MEIMKTADCVSHKFRYKWAILLGISLFVLLLSPNHSDAGRMPLPDTTNLDLSDTYTVQTYYRPVPDSSEKQVAALTVINAPIDLVWRTVVDYDNLGKGSKTIEVLGVEQERDEPTRVYLLLKMPWPLKDISCVLGFTENEKMHEVMWLNEGGCVKLNRGRITLLPAGDKTILELCVALELGNILPQWLVNRVLKKKLPNEISLIRKSVQDRKDAL